MFVENHLSWKVDYRRADMSTQTYCREQRKMRQVVDQIETLADNLDELRAEISAFKGNYLRTDASPENCCNRTKSIKSNMFQKLKKYVGKIRSMYLLKNGRVFASSQKVCYPGTDPPAPPFSSYIFRVGKSGNVSQVPAKIKYLKDECSQTDGKAQQFAALSIVETPLALKYMDNILSRETPPTKRASKRYDKTMRATLFPQSSEINGGLYSRVADPSDFKGFPQCMEVCLLNDKQSSSASTQTKAARIKRKRGSRDFQSKRPTMYLSRIKNTVITKRIIRNPYESTFRICGKIKRVKDYPYLKRRFYEEYSSNRRGGSNIVETVGHEISEEKYALEDHVQRLKIVTSTNDVYKHISSEEEGLSSTSISLDLELTVSNSCNRIEDSIRRRKPRTYTISKSFQKRNQRSWFDQVEGSVIYVERTSDLTLSSHSFSN